MWEMDINDAENPIRIYQINRTALPPLQYDTNADSCGRWELSGIIDVTKYFDNDCDYFFSNKYNGSRCTIQPKWPFDAALVESAQIAFICIKL